MKFALCAFSLFLGIQTSFGDVDNLVPTPHLRPRDRTKFYPGTVNMSGIHLESLQNIVVSNLNRPDLAEALGDPSTRLRKVAADPNFLAAVLPAATGNVQEWALKSLGEVKANKSVAAPALLGLATDRAQPDAIRALAVRILGMIPLDEPSLAKLAGVMNSASRDLRLIVLEALAQSGRSVIPFLPQIEGCLNDSDAAVQFYSLLALEKLEAAEPLDTTVLCPAYLTAKEIKATCETNATTLLRYLGDSKSPGHVAVLALLSGERQRVGDSEMLGAILSRTADPDPFVAETAVNVLSALDGIAPSAVKVLIGGLWHANAETRIRSAEAIANLKTPAIAAVPSLARALEKASRSGASAKEIAAYCGALRLLGTNAAMARQAVLAFLPEQHPVYRGLAKHEAYELRAWLLITLAEIGVPPEALPFVIDGLANTEDEMPYLFAAAARTAGALGPAAREAVPFLLRPLEGSIKDTFITFAKFGSHSAGGRDYTTCQIEALRALARIGEGAESAVPVIKQFLGRELPRYDDALRLQRAPNLGTEARTALAAIERQP